VILLKERIEIKNEKNNSWRAWALCVASHLAPRHLTGRYVARFRLPKFRKAKLHISPEH